ncbi:hypothetical protein ACRE1U_04660 [Helicobacter himalayensis]|uniref:hypothetical protein n=1 Tax=Helicobacter himalayensis TaxID=1591088 RepID=UPI003D700FD9
MRGGYDALLTPETSELLTSEPFLTLLNTPKTQLLAKFEELKETSLYALYVEIEDLQELLVYVKNEETIRNYKEIYSF